MNTQSVDVLAVMKRSAHQHWEHEDNADAEDAEAALAAVAELIEAAEKAKAALLTGQVGHINSDDVGVYHLDGITCGNALKAIRGALARVGGTP